MNSSGRSGAPSRAILQDAAQALAQLHAVVGLAHETVGARFQRLHDVVQAGQAGQQHDRNVGVERVVLQRAAQRKAIHAGHGDVADDQVRAQARHVARAAEPSAAIRTRQPRLAASRRARCCACVGLSSATRMSTTAARRFSLLCVVVIFSRHTAAGHRCHIGR
jgi:hypothetical protein